MQLSVKSLKYKLISKRNLLKNQINDNNITYKDIFEYIIENIKFITDGDIRTMYISGLRSIFINELKNAYPKLLNILIVLFAFNNEKEHYNINWKEKFYKHYQIQFNVLNKLKCFDKDFIDFSIDHFAFIDYKLYIAMNSPTIKYDLYYYKEIQKNLSQIKLIHYLIDKVNETKCKLFNIENIKNQE
ncbi:hypothetical protein NAPIS_ORF02279 [Vairimorpha apis BRL 01]|uniref:Uncharacterized protein n=1 Tax=Vairimorpha apis BRL 01 TaxID=1037528 RepID=T0L641_9MICR|nr:hypothetical protein NAPIS_ORF02279 [Vairimorpha apis BRL 01]